MTLSRSLAAALLLGAAAFTSASVKAEPASSVPGGDSKTAGKTRLHKENVAAERLDLLEHEVEQQAEAIKEQADEIRTLKAQLGGSSAQPEVTQAQFAELQSKVDEETKAKKDDAIVSFKSPTRFLHEKTQPTIASKDGRWSLAPFVLLQGDFASYSKGQPLSVPGTNNLKSSGENFRRARIGVQGIFAGDFSYSFIADFGGAGGDETYQAYAGPNTGTTKNASGSSITPYTASTASGTGARIFNAWVGYEGILDPFTLKVGILSTPANLGDMTQSDDLLFNERPSPSQLSRGLDGDDGRESAGFIGNGTWWNASLFLTGDTFGKAALIAPATTYGGSQEAVVGRVAFLPWQDWDSNFNVHVGGNFGDVIHPQEATSTANPGVTTYPITFSDRPELRVDNVTFLNTGAINARSAYAAGLEAAVSYGPLLLQGENFWYGIERNNPAAGVTNPTFSGWYVEGSWVLLGDPHRYNIANGSFVRPSPEEPFDPVAGDWGAWEIAGRYSSTNLDHDIASKTVADRVFGGVQNIASAGLNFYPNDVLRFVLDWQDVKLKNIGALNDNGRYDTISFRTQVSF